jgi:hypothetical protein
MEAFTSFRNGVIDDIAAVGSGALGLASDGDANTGIDIDNVAELNSRPAAPPSAVTVGAVVIVGPILAV